MAETLSGKIAMVTGGTSGIGRVIAARVLLEGAAAAMCGVSTTSVSGKIATVAGGTRGIGRGIGERLLSEAAAVAMCGVLTVSVEYDG